MGEGVGEEKRREEIEDTPMRIKAEEINKKEENNERKDKE